MTTTPARASVSTQVVILLLGLAVLLVLLILGLVWLAGADGRSDVLQWLTGIGTLIAGAAASTAVVQVRKVGQVATKIDEQTNGILDDRIQAGVSAALANHGIPLARRTEDPGQPDTHDVPPGQVRGYAAPSD